MDRFVAAGVVGVALVSSGACSAPGDDAAASIGAPTTESVADDSLPAELSTPPDHDQLSEDIGGDDDDLPDGSPIESPPNGVLRLAVVGEPVVDPLLASPVRPADMAVLDLLYDGLTTWRPDLGTWEPRLAETVRTSADGRRWTFVLGDAWFSDGSPIDAAAVAASLLRVRESDTLSGDRLASVREVVAIDPARVQVVLREPMATLPALLSSPLYGIVPAGRGAARGGGIDGTVASGPMAVIAPDGGDGGTVRLARWTVPAGPVAPQTPPPPSGAEPDAPMRDSALAEVVLVPVDEATAGTDAVRAGRVDLAYAEPGSVLLGTDAVARVAGNAVAAVALNVRAPSLVEDHRRAELASSFVREDLVAMAWNGGVIAESDLVSDAGDADTEIGRGAGTPPLLVDIDDDTQGIRSVGRCSPRCSSDPGLQVVGVDAATAGGTASSEWSPDGGAARSTVDGIGRLTVLLAQRWAVDTGGVVEPVIVDARAVGALVERGGHEAVLTGWVELFPGAIDALAMVRTGAADNVSGVADAAVDRLVGQAMTSGETVDVELAEAAVWATKGLVPVARTEVRAVLSDRVHGLRLRADGSFVVGSVAVGVGH